MKLRDIVKELSEKTEIDFVRILINNIYQRHGILGLKNKATLQSYFSKSPIPLNTNDFKFSDWINDGKKQQHIAVTYKNKPLMDLKLFAR